MRVPIISVGNVPWDNTKGRRREMGVCAGGDKVGGEEIGTFKNRGEED